MSASGFLEAVEHDGDALVLECFGGNTGPNPEAPHSEPICKVGKGPDALALARQFAAARELLGACREVMGLLDAGMLVRDTSRDMEPGWAMKNLRLVMGLKRVADAIAKAERGTADGPSSDNAP